MAGHTITNEEIDLAASLLGVLYRPYRRKPVSKFDQANHIEYGRCPCNHCHQRARCREECTLFARYVGR